MTQAANAATTGGSPLGERAAAAASARAAKTKLLLEAPIGPTLSRLAAPNIVAMFAMASTSIAEGYFAGVMGVSALAGLALVFPFVMLVQMLSAGAMGGAISSAVARALGSGDAARAQRLMLNALVIVVLAAAFFAVLFAGIDRALFSLLGGTGEGLEAALDFARIFFPGCLALWLCHGTLSVVRGTGNMVLPSVTLLLVSLGSVPLSGALALGWGPFPELGMSGLALGVVLAYAIGAVAMILYVASGRIGLNARKALGRLDPALFWDILRVGLIASVSALQTVLTIVVMVGLVGQFGESALAGYGLGTRLEFLMIPIVFGIGAAMTAMVGANIGAGQRKRALSVAWRGSLGAAAIVGVIGLFFAIWPDLWLKIFLGGGESAALDAGRTYFHIAAPFYGFFAIGLGFYFAGQGAGKVFWPVAAGVTRMIVAVGGGILLTQWFDTGLAGVFAAVATGMVVFGLLTVLSIKITGWR